MGCSSLWKHSGYFLKKRLVTTNRCNGFNGAAHPLCGNKPWNPLWIPRLVPAKSGCVCRNRRYFRLFRYTLDRGIIEVNVGVEVRLDKPKTRISYADTRVFVGGVREIWTLAALSDPTPLAGAPLRPLEYYSTSQSDKLFTFSHKMAERMRFEPMVRSRESLVFKTSSLNHSDTSPQWPPPRCDSYITISPAECQAWKWKNSKRNCKN